MPSRRVRAAAMSVSVGAVFVTANAKHLLQDLSDCAQRIELPTLYLVEQAPELRIFAHGCFQVPVCPRRGDGEHLVARARDEYEQHGVCDADHLDLALAGADPLEEDVLLAGRVEQQQRLQRRLGEPAEMASRPRRADEDARVEEVIAQPNAVTEE